MTMQYGDMYGGPRQRPTGAPVPNLNVQPSLPSMFPGLSPSNYGHGAGRVPIDPYAAFMAPRPDLPIMHSTGSLWGDLKRAPGVGLVPGLATAATWSDSGPWGKGFNLGMDAIDILLPLLGKGITTPLKAGVKGFSKFLRRTPDSPLPSSNPYTMKDYLQEVDQYSYDEMVKRNNLLTEGAAIKNLAWLGNTGKIPSNPMTFDILRGNLDVGGTPSQLWGGYGEMTREIYEDFPIFPFLTSKGIIPFSAGAPIDRAMLDAMDNLNMASRINQPIGRRADDFGFLEAQDALPRGPLEPNPNSVIINPQQQVARSLEDIAREYKRSLEITRQLDAVKYGNPYVKTPDIFSPNWGIPSNYLTPPELNPQMIMPSPFHLQSQPFTTAGRAEMNYPR
jgi:hypothetical protein